MFGRRRRMFAANADHCTVVCKAQCASSACLSQSPIPKTRTTVQGLSSELSLPSYTTSCSILPASHSQVTLLDVYWLAETVITCTVPAWVWSNAVLVVPPRSNHDPAQNRQLNLELDSPAISYNNPFWFAKGGSASGFPKISSYRSFEQRERKSASHGMTPEI